MMYKLYMVIYAAFAGLTSDGKIKTWGRWQSNSNSSKILMEIVEVI